MTTATDAYMRANTSPTSPQAKAFAVMAAWWRLKHKPIFHLVGERGSGKTMLLHHFIRKLDIDKVGWVDNGFYQAPPNSSRVPFRYNGLFPVTVEIALGANVMKLLSGMDVLIFDNCEIASDKEIKSLTNCRMPVLITSTLRVGNPVARHYPADHIIKFYGFGP